MTTRPEHEAPPEIYYGEEQAKKYATNSRILEIQTNMSRRAIELLTLPTLEDEDFFPHYILDLGCGSGISGEVLEEMGHIWVGTDISPHMLKVAVQQDANGDMLNHDMGQGLSFRIATFDGCISISALQWLCNADKKEQNPFKRLLRFFSSLYRCLKKGARAVFQFYPENSDQLDMITNAALKVGFGGGVVVDYPHSTRAKKYFLVLFAGIPENQIKMPKARDETDEEQTIKVHGSRSSGLPKKKGDIRPTLKSRDWILAKKDRDKKRGKEVRPNSKYTGRKRPTKF